MNGNDRSTLYDLADKQDRFEHEYSSELVTRIGLFLVFAGFVSGVALELLKLAFAEAPSATVAGRWAVISLLAISTLFLFVAIVWLLLTAFIPGYSVPGKVNDYRGKYKQLLDYHHGDHDAADTDLKDWILDATAEAVDQNSAQNFKRANAIARAQILLLVSIVFLFFSLAVFVGLRVQASVGPGSAPKKAALDRETIEVHDNATNKEGNAKPVPKPQEKPKRPPNRLKMMAKKSGKPGGSYSL